MDTMEYSLPVIALRGITILPNMVIHFDISRRRSIHAVEKSMADKQRVFLVGQKDPQKAQPGMDDVYRVGTIANIKQIIKLPKGIIRILVEGVEKAFLNELIESDNMLVAKVAVSLELEEIPDEVTSKAMVRTIHELLEKYAISNTKISIDIIKQLLEMTQIDVLLHRIAIDFPMDCSSRQLLLELDTISQLYTAIAKLLTEEIEVFHIKDELALKVKERVEENQRDYIMREQLKVIHEELDDGDVDTEIDEYCDAVYKLHAKQEIKDKILKEIRHYKTLSTNSSESNVTRGFIEMLLELPWDKISKDNKNIKRAEDVLNCDHYGLEKVKERIIEFLAVRSITKKGDSPIICLVGPPGTGKTSIARSVAKALNKKYVRISLGGVRDEAEIRGHRKTYVGAMPGRIVEGIKSAGVKNPLMLLDEIDKTSNEYRGDVSAALLEVLDGEQNSAFRDHYVELPIDLSQVLFIATANDLSKVDKPLLDRMEIIEIGSYTENEKFHIAKEYLISTQIKKNGLKLQQISFSDKAIIKIIQSYTREAGVRSLERKIGTVCRKVVKEMLTVTGTKKNESKITDKNLEKFLGKVIYFQDECNKSDDIGIVIGLAWTSVGGDTLLIEVSTMPGKGDLKLTGQMGDVMKESAEIALSYVRSVVSTEKYNVPEDYFDKHNIHLHIPEGAVPKDGPSAGITMATAIMSAVTGIPVKASVAMTGEITLRGKVLPIGGLKEKIIAAKSAGIKIVLVPEKNQRDIEEFDEEITKGLKVKFVRTMEDVIATAFAR